MTFPESSLPVFFMLEPARVFLDDVDEESGLFNIDLAYLDVDGSVIASPANCAAYDSIRFVRAQLAQGSGGYSFEFVTPVNLMGFPKTMAMPPFQVILPRESLGWTNSGTPCSS